MRQLILGCLLVTLCGCATKPIVINNSSRFAATGSAFEGQGAVYMMRNLSRGGEAWPVQVELDGAMEGSLRRGTYVRIPVTPGRHNIVAHWSRLSGSRDVAMSVEFEAGKTYYFVIGTNFSNTPVYGPIPAGTTLSGLVPIRPDAGAELVHEWKDRTPHVSK